MQFTMLFAAAHLTGTSIPCLAEPGSVGHKADHLDHMRTCGNHHLSYNGENLDTRMYC